MQQLPVWTARKHLEDKCLLHIVVHNLYNTGHEGGLNFVVDLGVHVGNVYPHSFCSVIKIGFNIADARTWNNRICILIHKVPLHGMTGVWCAMIAKDCWTYSFLKP